MTEPAVYDMPACPICAEGIAEDSAFLLMAPPNDVTQVCSIECSQAVVEGWKMDEDDGRMPKYASVPLV